MDFGPRAPDSSRLSYFFQMRTRSVLTAIAVSTATAPTRPPSLTPHLSIGDTLSVVFARTISFKIDGYADYVRRISGTASFLVLDTMPNHLRFDNRYRFDGLLEGREPIEIRDGGRSQCDSAGTCARITDATGLLFNPLQWGEPDALRDGAKWTVRITEPWELGPAGIERVTVLHVDPTSNTVTLEREGQGDGAYAGDRLQIPLQGRDSVSIPVTVIPGRSHWIGHTTFQRGRVISDEILVERPVVVTSDKVGRISGIERQYIVFDAMSTLHAN